LHSNYVWGGEIGATKKSFLANSLSMFNFLGGEKLLNIGFGTCHQKIYIYWTEAKDGFTGF
jgi:hypothetical protein